MIFLNPKTELAFKKIFGSEDNKDILISFLNAMLYEGQNVIQELKILYPFTAPKIRGVNRNYLDVNVKTTPPETSEYREFMIEIQILKNEGFEYQLLHRVAELYSTQLGSGDDYRLPEPIIAFSITDFVLFPDHDAVVSKFVINDREFLMDYPMYDVELVFVELPKFNKELSELATITDKWLYFLNNVSSLDRVPELLAIVPEIKKAFDLANRANLSPDELDLV